MAEKLRPLAKCGVATAQQWREYVAGNVQQWIKELEAAGVTHWDIATRVGCHRTAISLWKHGKADMYAGSYEALRDFAAEVRNGRRVGT